MATIRDPASFALGVTFILLALAVGLWAAGR
jgi:hypothetical protein